MSAAEPVPVDRRAELLSIAAGLFAERGLRATTVRDIADAAGILSGSLYHHFDSKESMVDEILRDFLDSLFGQYTEIVGRGLPPLETLRTIIGTSFTAIHEQRAAVAIYQAEARHLSAQPTFAYIRTRVAEFRGLWFQVLEAGIADGSFRADLDVELAYRFLRDTVWVGVGWYRPGGSLTIEAISAQYISIVVDGMAPRTRSTPKRSTQRGDRHG
jgi:AcrR family transcriptional regulator